MRTFIAIPFNPELIQKMNGIRKDLKKGITRGVTWSDSSKTHLTLKFLGEIDVNQVVQINKVLAAICSENSPFEIYCNGIGCFPSFLQPRVVWMAIRPEPKLFTLQTLIENACYSSGFPKDDKRFSPHFTLGRIRENLQSSELEFIQEMEKKEQESIPVCLIVEEIIFYKSQLFKTGPVYSQISSFKLKRSII
jgi:RNA 2',3'-cyclic 3'-phosphodiesterase